MAGDALIPISRNEPTDIFVCGYPKSGNTWFQNLLAGTVFGVNSAYAHDALIQELVPDLHYKLDYRRYAPTMCFKSHHLPQREYRRVVYLIRDGRDVMVSYYHFLMALRGPMDFMSLVAQNDLWPSPWHVHVEQWLANPFQADILVVRYEDLIRDAHGQMRRFCRFAGLTRSAGELKRAVAQASFESLRGKEKKQGLANKAWPSDKAFFRRGKVGSYRDEMPADVLNAFLEVAGETLHRLGYLTKDPRSTGLRKLIGLLMPTGDSESLVKAVGP